MKIPKTLNMGSGKDFRKDCINIDNAVKWKPDIVYDLNHPMTWWDPKFYDTERFGQLEVYQRMFEKIIANDVLEHITNLTGCMKSCLDLLVTGGVMEIYVPYDLSLGAWQDPTHVRAFNQNSWLYYTTWSWYLGWEEEKFEMTKLEFRLSVIGKAFKDLQWKTENIINVPRAVDGMRVELKKIITHNPTEGGQND